MDDDKTVLRRAPSRQAEFDPDHTVLIPKQWVQVNLLDVQDSVTATFSFASQFTAGRAQDNSIVIPSHSISRHHIEVKQENDDWWLYDLNSRNGTYIHDKLVEHRAKIDFPALVALGTSGIRLAIQLRQHGTQAVTDNAKRTEDFARSSASSPQAQHPQSTRDLSPERIKARLLAEAEAEDAGEYTQMVRRLIREDRTSRGRSYKKVIWSLTALFCLAAGLVTYQQIALSNARSLAIDMFYDIKTLEVSLSQADIRVDESTQALDRTMKAIADEKLRVQRDQIKAEQEKLAAEKKRLMQEMDKLKRMKAKYQQYVNEANSLRFSFPTAAHYEEELITRVARGFGESELELPKDFVTEVRKYVKYWQNSSRMEQGMNSLEKNNYAPTVISALEKQGLPLHFIYLPLQESNYDNQAIGPETRFGIAKGAWQFLATTAQEYGLSPGPLAGTREYDEQDSRFDFNQATRAGTKYLKHIYSTEAQASGLLVIASYNYGHNRVRTMIQNMPDNPREKNFWKFIQRYEIPKETYDYVFYIFSAAVIGEDPRHFGFKFKPPLLVSN